MEKISIYEKPVRMKTILPFTTPVMLLMVFSSLYTVVDGIVVSNFVGSLGLSAINIVYPLLNLGMAVSFMFATGSNAIIARKLGEGRKEEANQFMSLVTIMNLIAMALLTASFMIWDEPLYRMLGADDQLMPYCVEYGRIMVPGGMFFALQVLFQNYLVTADKPRLSLGLTIGAGVANIILDVLLVGVFDMGVGGAAVASVIGQAAAGLFPLTVFFSKKQIIHFEKPRWNGRELLFSMANGSSEMVTNLASAVTTTLFNLQMMAIVGEKGVAAISAILYLQFIFVAIFLGFTTGIAPVVSYNYGAGNKNNLKKLFRISIQVIGCFSILMFAISELFHTPLVMVFASKDPALRDLMIHGFMLLAVSFLFSGINIFASGYFTALNNGKISAFISMMRTFVLEVGALLLLPAVWGLDGVWLALPVAEFIAAVISVTLLIRYKKRYGY